MRSLGCKDPLLLDDPKDRKDPIRDCYVAAKNQGFTIFGLQIKACYSSKIASLTYSLYPPKIDRNCHAGLGGTNFISVYYILQPG